jgi:hypothetical protein
MRRGDIVADTAADARIDAQKRRSTRISQAVPITVTGVDALGRPFQERTSTVVVNCHGCRYQSKHYVLKNMWVTLEVPHAEATHQARSVRARVTWIQRPRTVRELFQIGAELEVPGNLWGIAFPQPDWFAFPEQSDPEAAAAAAELPAPAAPEDSPRAEPLPAMGNLRILPVAGSSDASPALEQQVAGLVEQAREQLQAAVRESAAQVATTEAGPLLAAMQKQLEQAAERSVQTIAEAAAKRAVQESLGRTALKTQEHLKALQRRWTEDLEAGIQQAKKDLQRHFAESSQEQSASLTLRLEEFLEPARARIAQAFQDGEAALAQSREALSALRQQASSVADVAIEEMNQRLRARAEETQAGWHTRLHADLTAATELWNQRIESSLESAAQKSAERLARNSQAAAERLENELGSRISSLGKVFAEATAEAEAKLGTLRAAVQGEVARAQSAMAQVQSAALGIDEHTAKFDAITRNAQQELQRRAATVLEGQSRELARRAEGALASWTEKLRPSLEAAGQQAVARLVPQIDQDIAARLKPAAQAYARLERGVAAADEALLRQQEAIARASDQAVETARGRLQETIDRMSREIEEAGRTSSAKWLAEIDAKATETTHNTFESLFKTADWYEKKVQMQMQAALEKGLEQAAAGLREKAGEISRVFASELDHYNRSYVEHSHSQLEEAAREVFERARGQFSELAAESLGSLTRQAQAQVEVALADVHTQAGTALGQISAQTAALLTQARTDILEEGRRLSAEFRAALSSDSQEALASARHDLTVLTASSVAELRSEARAQQTQLAQALATSSEQAIQEYKKRLESASNSWLLTTASRLDQQSQHLIQSIAESAQRQVRDSCARVFSEIGDNLRQRGLELPAPPSAKGATAST